MPDIASDLVDLNARLKARGVKCRVELKDGTFWLRKTLPPKPSSDRDRPYQQRISTGLKGKAGLKIVERRAELLAAAIATNTFKWEDWGWEPKRKEPKTCGDWVAAFEEQWRRRGNRAEVTWRKDYLDVFKHLPQNRPLTEQVLLDRIDQTKPQTRTRDRNCVVLGALARFAGLDVDLTIYKGYKQEQVNPRLLPADEQLMKWIDQIEDRGWQWAAAMMATYGLRNHEVFRVKLELFPILEVSKNTKTGWRYVNPLYPEWAERWNLSDRKLPPVIVKGDNRKLGEKMTGFFKRQKWKREPEAESIVTGYVLRHCYARRAWQHDYSCDDTAAMMGHSPKIHGDTYRAWIDSSDYLERYRRLLEKSDRRTERIGRTARKLRPSPRQIPQQYSGAGSPICPMESQGQPAFQELLECSTNPQGI